MIEERKTKFLVTCLEVGWGWTGMENLEVLRGYKKKRCDRRIMLDK